MFPGGRSGGSKARKLFRPRCARTWLWERLSRGVDRMSRPFPPHDDPNRDGMSRRRDCKHRNRLFQWISYPITQICRRTPVAVALGLLSCLGCRQQSTPEAIYSSIEKQLISGELSKAQEQSRQAYESFGSGRPEWKATFRIEFAKILIYQGQSSED